METYLDSYPCLLRLALSASRRAGASENLQHSILLNTMEQLSAFPSDSAPIFFLLQAKCNVIARDLSIAEGGTVLKQQEMNSSNT